MAHLTAIIDQITRMENSLVNILLETAVKLSTLTDANIFVMVESASGRKWAGRKSLRDEYVRGMLKPSSKDVEVTETVASMPQEEFSMGSLMGMAGGVAGRDRADSPDLPTQTGALYGAGPAVFPMAQQQPQPRDLMDPQPSAAKRPRISTSESTSMNLPSNNIHPSAAAVAAAAAAAKTLNLSNNNVASSPPQPRRKSPNRDQISQPVIHDGGRSSPKPPSSNSRQETISKNLKDEFNGDEHPPDDAVVIKEELGRMTASRAGAGRGGAEGVDDTFEDVDPDASVDGGGGGSWGEMALAGPSGIQQSSDGNQPLYLAELLEGTEKNVLANFWREEGLDSLTNRELIKLEGEAGELVGETPCPYPGCDKLFSNVGALRRHIKRIHQNNYAFRCGVCGKGFNEKRDFKLHVDTHSGVKNYKCPHCNRPYSQSGSMHRHARKCLGQSAGGGGAGTEGDVEDGNKIVTFELTYGDEYRSVAKLANLEHT